MYLHIGGSQMIDVRHIVAFFHRDPGRTGKANPVTSYHLPYRLADPQHGAHVRSYVLTDEAIYGSPLAVQTLVRRYEALLSVE
ncbi:DUF370 domain-containing protein [Megasphaera hominis]|jgi:hypothetical protein|uniref:DUF370 domain-containing protein n=1 Tax=Megasphaera hominis TaxID=159836 RepID=A0ABR6VGI9_9FIRM|nr:DUF370 domain-containing protein [Megasphaera hominis]MBC3536341.1 DUF370 domain-containing protein [Megasphaera hominis]